MIGLTKEELVTFELLCDAEGVDQDGRELVISDVFGEAGLQQYRRERCMIVCVSINQVRASHLQGPLAVSLSAADHQ